MNKILLATDFTGCSENAQQFASELAIKTHSELIVLNVFTIPVIEPPASTFYTDALVSEMESEAKENMDKVVSALRKEKYPDGERLKVEGVVEHASPAGKINQIAEDKGADLIVIGSKGVDLVVRLTGSTTIDVASTASTAVLVVPSRAEWHGFQKLAYASDLKAGDYNGVKKAVEMARIFDAELHVIHVNEDDRWFETKEFRELEKKLKEELEYKKLNFEQIKTKDAAEGVDLFIQLDKADLLVMLKEKRNFLQNLFHKSFIKKEIYYSETPLLVLQG